MGITGTMAAIGGGLSLASMGMKAGADTAAGYAKAQELETKATNAILQSTTQAANFQLQGAAQATNARLQGESTATNAELQGGAAATNARFQAGAQAAQFGIQSQEDLMRESSERTAADFGDMHAAMTDAAARDDLRTTLGNIVTTRAAGGADLTSPTTAALMGHVSGISDLNREAAVTSISAQSAEERAAADYLHQASAFALTQGDQAKAMGDYNARVDQTFADFNADTARKFGNYNADVATTYANFNADQARKYGQINADAAYSAAGTAVNMGFLNAGGDILGGLGKAFSGFGGSPGASPSGGSAAP